MEEKEDYNCILGRKYRLLRKCKVIFGRPQELETDNSMEMLNHKRFCLCSPQQMCLVIRRSSFEVIDKRIGGNKVNHGWICDLKCTSLESGGSCFNPNRQEPVIGKKKCVSVSHCCMALQLSMQESHLTNPFHSNSCRPF